MLWHADEMIKHSGDDSTENKSYIMSYDEYIQRLRQINDVYLIILRKIDYIS